MARSLGAISGQVRLDAAQAIAAFAAVRAASARTAGTVTAAGTKLTAFGKVSMVAGLALVAGFGVAIKAAADFEKKMDYFGAVNNATAKQMEQVRQKALQLGRDSQYSAGQIADAFVEMAKAGVSVKDITGGMADAIINLAAAADIKLDESTQIVTSQIQAYGLSVKDAAHITDLLAGAANASIVDVSDLGVSLKYLGGVAHALGVSFDSSVDALSLLGKAGIKGSTAGTSLRQIMVSLGGATSKATDELKDLGIITKDGTNQFFDANGKAKSLAQVFQILQDHTRGLTQEQQLMAFKTIFNNRALAAAEILTKQGAAGFANMAAQMSKTTAADVAAKRLDNLSGDIKHLKSSIDTLMIQAGTPFQNMLRSIVQNITKVINAFINMPAGVQTAILAFVGITGVILTLLGAIAIIGGTIFKAVATIKQLAAAFRLLWVSTKLLTTATWEMTVAALSNPYVLIGIAVIALVTAMYLLYTRSEKFRSIMNAIGSGFKTGFQATVNWFKSLPAFFEGLWTDISNWFKTGIGWVKKNWDILLAIMTGPVGAIILIWHRFGDQITGFFKAIPGQITNFASKALSVIITFFKNLPYEFGYGLGITLGIIIKGIYLFYKAFWDWGNKAIDVTISFFKQLPGILANFFVKVYKDFIKWAQQFGVGVKNWAVGAYNATVDWFSKLPGRVANFFVDLWHRSGKEWNNFTSALGHWLSSTYNAVVNWFSKLPGRVANFLVDMKNQAVSKFNSMVSIAKNFGESVYNGLMSFIEKIPGAVSGAISNTISAFRQMISSAYASAKDFGKGLWDGFKKGIGINSPSYIEKAMWQITAVTDTETKKLGNQVRVMQGLAGKIAQTNPAKASAGLNTATIANMTRNMKQQAALLQAATVTLFPTGIGGALAQSSASSASSAASQAVRNAAGDVRPINVQVFNPVAERASDTTARKLRQLSDMGAL